MKIKKLGVVLLMVCFVFSSLGIQAFAADIGDALLEVESGWKRYDSTYSNFSKIGDDITNVEGNEYAYNGTYTITHIDEKLSFKFNGQKIRIISAYANEYRSNNILIRIDGVEERFNQNLNSGGHNIICFEKTGLENKLHNVKIMTDNNTTESENSGGKVFEFSAIDIDEDGEILPYNETAVLVVEPEKETVKQSETVSAKLVIDNINEIVAEDIRINYDEEKLEFLGFEEVDGMKLVKSVEKTAKGDLRVIVASEGEANIINAKEVLLKLKFKGIGTGEALVDITNGRVTDGIELEKDLDEEKCGEATIVIEGLKDVNNSGEFTLLDLGIDARHLSKDPASSELDEYNTDIVVNGEIDDEDLLEIGRLILDNPNYTPNN